MKIRRSRLPTLGFLAVCLTFLAQLGFFVWGFSRPDLDRVWQLRHELKLGTSSTLSEADRELLERSMARHAQLGRALLGGEEIGVISARTWQGWLEVPYALLIRTPQARDCRRLIADVHTAPDLLPYQLLIRGPDWERVVDVPSTGPLTLELPPSGPVADLISVHFLGHDFPADPSRIGTKLSVDCPAALAQTRERQRWATEEREQ